MTQPPMETRQGLLWKQQHLAPPAIPTGQSAQDLLNLIWRKNEIYLDIGSFAMSAGWITLHAMTFVFLISSLCISLSAPENIQGNIDWLFHLIGPVPGLMIMGPLWYLFIRDWKKPLRPPLRFNRQRREVCVTEADGTSWFVPWECVHAIAPSVTNLGTYGAMQNGALIIWLPLKGEEHEPYHENKEGYVFMTNPGPGASAMAQWECIRSFMEVGPGSVPEPSPSPDWEGSFWGAVARSFIEAGKEKGWGYAVFVTGLIHFLIFNILTYAHIARKKLAVLPDLTIPEAIEWSKPLPPEQWARRSPELAQDIAEREAELTTSDSPCIGTLQGQ
jgi:hypothetical protein